MLNQEQETRLGSLLRRPTAGAMTPLPLAPRNGRRAHENKFALSLRLEPRNHYGRRLQAFVPRYPTPASLAPKKSALTIACSGQSFLPVAPLGCFLLAV